MAVLFGCTPDWLKTAAPHFRDGLVGSKEAPKFTEQQIADAFAETIRSHKYGTPPKIADVLRIARENAPLPAMQKRHTDPTPERRWTLKERRRNLAFVDAIMAKVDEIDSRPEYEDAKRQHGWGSPQVKAIHQEQRAELRAWIDDNAA